MTYSFGELDMLVPAYAVTIHKSQGSEYSAVVIDDGGVGDENCTDQLIAAYFTMMQAGRDLDRGCAVDDEPIDKLIGAFEAWVAS